MPLSESTNWNTNLRVTAEVLLVQQLSTLFHLPFPGMKKVPPEPTATEAYRTGMRSSHEAENYAEESTQAPGTMSVRWISQVHCSVACSEQPPATRLKSSVLAEAGEWRLMIVLRTLS